MKAALGPIVLVAALGAWPMTVRAASPRTAMSADHNLDEQIEKRLDASSLKKYHIKVSVENGVAMLKGAVATEADRRKATQLATLPEIARVDNQLTVDAAAPTGTTGTKKKEVRREK
jgi:osmotically-inducible protein OsmY